MASIYRSIQGQRRVQDWCSNQLDRWSVPHQRFSILTGSGATHVVSVGEGTPVVVALAGNFNAATCLPLAQALAQRWPVWIVDVPGQPCLSAAGRPDHGGLAWYGQWLSEFLDRVATGSVRLRCAVARPLAADLKVLAGAGHLAPEEYPYRVVNLVEEVIRHANYRGQVPG